MAIRLYCAIKSAFLVSPFTLRHYLTTLLVLTTGSAAFAQEPTDGEIALPEIVVEEDSEPEAPLPLGTGVSGETLRKAPGSGGDPTKTLQTLPGMTYANDEEPLPAVRGSRPGDNDFLVDFAPAYYLFHFGGAISVFNSDLVKTFNIYQSAYGPEYSGVTGGVFDVELREPKTDRLRTTIDIGLLQAGALLEGPISENQSFYLAGRFSYLDLLLSDLEEEEGIKIQQFPKYSDYQGKYVWKLPDDEKLTVQFNGATDEERLEIAEDAEAIDTDPIFAGTIAARAAFHEQAIVWDKNFSSQLSTKSIFSHSDSKESGTFGGAGHFDVDIESLFLKSRITYSLNDRHDLILGAQVEQSAVDLEIEFALPPCGELDPDCFSTGAETLSTVQDFSYTGYRAYLKDNWYLTDRLSLYPGLAFQSENLLNKHFIEPRLALEYSLSEATTLSAGVGQYNQSPGYIEQDETFGNPDVDYINALHGLLGVQHVFSSGWDVKSELYYKALDNLVTSDEELNYSNDGEGYSYGLDTLIRKNLSSKLSGWMAISLSESRRKDKRSGETFAFDYDQPFNISLVGNYKFNNRWSVGGKLWVHSGAPVTPVIGATEDPDNPGFFIPEFGKLNSDRFPTYHRLDLRVDRTKKRRNGNSTSTYFEILNVLGTQNAGEYDYNADYTEKEIQSQMTRFFNLGIKATF